MTKPFTCYNLRYMAYGYLSNYALCSQPPVSCPHETNENIKLQTGRQQTIFYCTRQVEQTTMERKGIYIGLQLTESVVEPASTCSLSGRK